MDWSGINENLKKAIEIQNKSQQARMNLQSKLMISKIDALQEQRIKEMQPDYQIKELALRQYREQMAGGQGGQFDISGGGDIKRLGLKDMAERVYMKPQEQWTPSDKAIVKQYHTMLQDTPQPVVDPATGDENNFSNMFNETPKQAETQTTGRIRVKIKGGTGTGTIDAGEFDPNMYEKI